MWWEENMPANWMLLVTIGVQLVRKKPWKECWLKRGQGTITGSCSYSSATGKSKNMPLVSIWLGNADMFLTRNNFTSISSPAAPGPDIRWSNFRRLHNPIYCQFKVIRQGWVMVKWINTCCHEASRRRWETGSQKNKRKHTVVTVLLVASWHVTGWVIEDVSCCLCRGLALKQILLKIC